MLSIGGRELMIVWLAREVPRVSTRVDVVLFFSCKLAANVNQMPIRITVGADELPEDVEVVTLNTVFKVYDPANTDQLRGVVRPEKPPY
jgi:hypothetical protein